MTVTWRRAITTAVGLTALVVSATGAAAGSPVAVHPKAVHVSRGDITIVQTTVNGGLEEDYDVTLTGPLAVHGWSHTGVLQGTSVANIPETFGTGIPAFPVSTDDGVVTGDCGGERSDDPNDTTTLGLPNRLRRPQFRLNCDLSDNGSVAWHVSLTAQTDQRELDADRTAYSGTYQLVDAETSLVGINEGVTYGDVQLRSYNDGGGGQQLGPLLFSGQIVIGSGRYVGDLVSGLTPYAATSAITDLPVSGSNAGHSVSGTCSGDLNAVFFELVGTVYDLTCDLSLDGGPVVSVPLRAFFTSSDGRCSGRQCWGDDTGYFTAN